MGACHKVLMEDDYNILLIVGDPRGIIYQQLRHHLIHLNKLNFIKLNIFKLFKKLRIIQTGKWTLLKKGWNFQWKWTMEERVFWIIIYFRGHNLKDIQILCTSFIILIDTSYYNLWFETTKCNVTRIKCYKDCHNN